MKGKHGQAWATAARHAASELKMEPFSVGTEVLKFRLG